MPTELIRGRHYLRILNPACIRGMITEDFKIIICKENAMKWSDARSLVLSVAIWAMAVGPTVAARDSDEVRDIGHRRELLLDDWLIDRLTGAELRLQQPVPREIALPLNQPWAGPRTGFTCVFRDGDLYRLYYTSDSDGQSLDYTSYAESRDGHRVDHSPAGQRREGF